MFMTFVEIVRKASDLKTEEVARAPAVRILSLPITTASGSIPTLIVVQVVGLVEEDSPWQ